MLSVALSPSPRCRATGCFPRSAPSRLISASAGKTETRTSCAAAAAPGAGAVDAAEPGAGAAVDAAVSAGEGAGEGTGAGAAAAGGLAVVLAATPGVLEESACAGRPPTFTATTTASATSAVADTPRMTSAGPLDDVFAGVPGTGAGIPDPYPAGTWKPPERAIISCTAFGSRPFSTRSRSATSSSIVW